MAILPEYEFAGILRISEGGKQQDTTHARYSIPKSRLHNQEIKKYPNVQHTSRITPHVPVMTINTEPKTLQIQIISHNVTRFRVLINDISASLCE